MVARNSSKVEERDRNSPPAPITGDARDAGSNPAWFLEGLPDAVDTTGIGSLMAERLHEHIGEVLMDARNLPKVEERDRNPPPVPRERRYSIVGLRLTRNQETQIRFLLPAPWGTSSFRRA